MVQQWEWSGQLDNGWLLALLVCTIKTAKFILVSHLGYKTFSVVVLPNPQLKAWNCSNAMIMMATGCYSIKKLRVLFATKPWELKLHSSLLISHNIQKKFNFSFTSQFRQSFTVLLLAFAETIMKIKLLSVHNNTHFSQWQTNNTHSKVTCLKSNLKHPLFNIRLVPHFKAQNNSHDKTMLSSCKEAILNE
jgi:hypothetical protein